MTKLLLDKKIEELLAVLDTLTDRLHERTIEKQRTSVILANARAALDVQEASLFRSGAVKAKNAAERAVASRSALRREHAALRAAEVMATEAKDALALDRILWDSLGYKLRLLELSKSVL